MRSPSFARGFALVLVLSASGGCFALFSLDGYGPPSSIGPDDGAVAADRADGQGDGDAAGGSAGRRLVFVTSTETPLADGKVAGFVGTTGADALCAAFAAAAKLPGTYRAWIADQPVGQTPGTGPKAPSSFSLANDTRALVTTTGQVIAGDLAELIEAGPRSAINVTEDASVLALAPGVPVSTPLVSTACPDSGLVWSGIRGNGSENPPNCDLWTTTGSGKTGGVGRMAKDPSEWTQACDVACDQRARLYCVQQ